MPGAEKQSTTPVARSAVTPAAPPAAAPAPEPDGVRHTFNDDPLNAARHALVAHVRNTTGAGMRWNSLIALARRAAAMHALASVTNDDTIRDLANEDEAGALDMLAEEPAADVRDVRLKLCMLLHQCITQLDQSEATGLCAKLATSALVDLVVLEDGPIVVPEAARRPIATAEDIAHWRRIAAEDHAAQIRTAAA